MPTIKAPTKFELAKLHLDRFWYEIFWRRENEQKITVWTVGLFGALLTLVYGRTTPLANVQKGIISAFPLMLGSIAFRYLRQNSKKNKEIARQIVRLNEALGAWENNYLVNGSSLYPEKWKQWGNGEYSQSKVSFLYYIIVIGSTLLTTLGIIFN